MKVEIKSKKELENNIDWDIPQLICDDNKNPKKVYLTTGKHNEKEFEAIAFHPSWDNPHHSTSWLKCPLGGTPESWKIFEGKLTLNNNNNKE